MHLADASEWVQLRYSFYDFLWYRTHDLCASNARLQDFNVHIYFMLNIKLFYLYILLGILSCFVSYDVYILTIRITIIWALNGLNTFCIIRFSFMLFPGCIAHHVNAELWTHVLIDGLIQMCLSHAGPPGPIGPIGPPGAHGQTVSHSTYVSVSMCMCVQTMSFFPCVLRDSPELLACKARWDQRENGEREWVQTKAKPYP